MSTMTADFFADVTHGFTKVEGNMLLARQARETVTLGAAQSVSVNGGAAMTPVLKP